MTDHEATFQSSPPNKRGWDAADAERMKWLSGIVSASPRAITDEGARELHSLCLRAIREIERWRRV